MTNRSTSSSSMVEPNFLLILLKADSTRLQEVAVVMVQCLSRIHGKYNIFYITDNFFFLSFFTIDLPQYTKKEILRQRLLTAIRFCGEIDTDG